MTRFMCLAASLLFLAGCADEPVAVRDPVASTIVITTELGRADYRHVSQLGVEVRDSDGNPLDEEVTWSTSDSLTAPHRERFLEYGQE